jgi:DNA-binding transcriptional ArsR family regulator
VYEESDRERERREKAVKATARANETRAAILDHLHYSGELTLGELAAQLAQELPEKPLSVLNYHLMTLREARLVACDDGIYRAL